MKLISSCKNSIRIGSVVVRPKTTTDVPKKDLDGFLKNDYGKSMFDLFFKKVVVKNRSKK